MEKRCYGCMKTYDSSLNVCPHCGYVDGTKPESPLHLSSGTILNNRYEVGRVIGYGGFGVTYIAWDKVLEQRVAVKEYLPSEFSTRAPGVSQVTVYDGDKGEQYTAGMDKFVDEARRLAKFTDCPGIVKVYDCFKENGTAYIAMEYLEGVTLSKYIKDKGTIPPEDAVMMLLPIIDSLDKVNKAGIIHRDIAPDNIMVTDDGDVKLIDFGAARYATTIHSRSLTVIVKPGYSPEEQYRSRGDQGPHTDVYAVGATLYKMITGVTPPDAMERRAFLERDGKNTLQPPSKYVKGISKNLDNAIMNAMHIRVDKRTKDMETLMYELTTEDAVKLTDEGISRVFDPRKWPLWLKIVVPAMAAVVLVLSGLFVTGVIGFDANRQDDIYTELGMVRVPWVVNKELEEASVKLNEKTLSYSIAGKEYSSDVPKDRVLTQDIEGAMPVKENTVLNITISGGAETKTLPKTEGSDSEEVRKELEDMGFAITIKEEYSDVIAEGCIIGQNVDGMEIHSGDEVETGSSIELIVSKGRDPQKQLVEQDIVVPDFTGMTYEEALAQAEDSGLVISITEKRYSNTYAADIIMEQDVKAGSTIKNTESVGLVISLGIKLVKVPDVQYMNKDNAIEALTANELKYTIVEAENENVAAGVVISQSVERDSQVAPGTLVELVVSTGPSKKDVPDVTGMDETEAKSTLSALGLVVNISYANSDTVANGKVISQSITGSKVAKKGDSVSIVVSSGEILFEVPNVVGSDRATAEAALKNAGFSVMVDEQYSENVASGQVISQSETAGTSIKKNSTVLIVVSKGAQTITVPNVVGKDSDAAIKAMTDAGLSVSTQQQSSDTVAAGKVISQSVGANTSVKPGTPVTLIVSSGVEKVTVPDVVGSALANAQSALSGCGLSASVSEQYSDNVAAGVVISQSVAAGSSVNKGSSVGIVVSRGPENAGVPNVIGSDRGTAISALQAAGFNVNEGEAQYSDTVPAGCVISQDVAGGSQVKKGTTVTIVVSKGQEMVTVPDVVGMTAAEAESRLSQYGISVTRSEEYSSTVPSGSVISQSVGAGGSVPKNTTITIVVSKGPELVTVPDVTGIDAASAESKLSQSGLDVSRGGSEYSDTVAEGSVISQSVSAGSKVAINSTVTIIVSKGIQPFTVSFDSNGGSGVGSMTVKKGDTLSGLPTPTKDYCDFTGWTYNGSNADGMTVSGDMTLTANWRDKATSDWVAEGSIPAGAKVVDNKWTYTVSTTETTWSRGDAPLDDQGYVRTGNEEWRINATGESYYCNGFPDGDYQNYTQLVGGIPWTAGQNDIYILDVTSEWAGYVYWHWMYDSGGTEYGIYTRNISQKSGWGTALTNKYYKYYGEFTSSSDYQRGNAGYNNNTGWPTYVNTGRTSYADNQGTDRWFRFDYYKAAFVEKYKWLEYSKTTVESFETVNGEPSGNGVGNIQHLVRYIPK